ncbi:7177_t:CDS:2 [Gigaspora margarita]|uniref:7177_t:CDS:1 n=1 Tax=Gigaspora margarita TaxID=4874 RepID=A0ABM8W5G1_GIGMA|nr:7177_t:CDS:2 [Gigaspora margarita]
MSNITSRFTEKYLPDHNINIGYSPSYHLSSQSSPSNTFRPAVSNSVDTNHSSSIYATQSSPNSQNPDENWFNLTLRKNSNNQQGEQVRRNNDNQQSESEPQLAKVVQEGNEKVIQRLNGLENLMKNLQKPSNISISTIKRND